MITLVVEISKEGEKLKMSAFERSKGIDVTLKHYNECTISNKEIENLCDEITGLFNKAVRKNEPGENFSDELKKNGRALFDQLLTLEVKKAIKNTKADFLLISIDEHLVQIPWELLHDGEEFLCIRFAMGRSVRTKQRGSESKYRNISSPIKMLVVADPTGDLNAAYDEGIAIRGELDKRKNKVKVLSKTREVYTDFIKRNIRDYDIIHFAGHAEYNSVSPSESGWVLKDGKFTAKDIVALGATAPMPSIVFSNACQSGKTQEWEINKGFENEIYGLANAFLLAGARHYIGTCWKVADKICLDFANEFYRNVTDGLPIGEAVKQSRIKLIKKYGYSSIVWSSYMLYGDPTIDLLDVMSLGVKTGKEIYPKYKKRHVVFILFTIILIIILAKYFLIRNDIPSIAVFGITDQKNHRTNWALSQEIMSNLKNITLGPLEIVDLSTLLTPSQLMTTSPRDICGRFNISLMVSGEYKQNAEKIESYLRLIKPDTGRVISVKQFSTENEIDFVGKATILIIEMTKRHLSPKDKEKIQKKPTNNLEAYKLFNETWEMYLQGYNSKVIEICEKVLELDPNYVDVYKRLGNVYDRIGQRQKALEYYIKYEKVAQRNEDLENVSNANLNIGWVYGELGEYEKEIDHYKKGLMIAQDIGYSLGEAKAYRRLGGWYEEKEEYDLARTYFLKSAFINKRNSKIYNHRYALAESYLDIGLIYADKDQYDKALKYYEMALKLYEEMNVPEGKGSCYTNIGEMYMYKGLFDKALESYFKALIIDKKMNDIQGLGTDYNIIGELYYKKGDYEKALENFEKSLSVRNELGNDVYISETQVNVGRAYYKLKKFEDSLKYFKTALEIGNKLGKERCIFNYDEIEKMVKEMKVNNIK